MKTISHETILKICELLEIDPNDTIEIKIDPDFIKVTTWHAHIDKSAS